MGAWVGPCDTGLVVVVEMESVGHGPLYLLCSLLSLQWALERSQLWEMKEYVMALKFSTMYY